MYKSIQKEFSMKLRSGNATESAHYGFKSETDGKIRNTVKDSSFLNKLMDADDSQIQNSNMKTKKMIHSESCRSIQLKRMAVSGLKGSALVLVLIFVACPTLLKLFPCIYTEIVFLQRLRWPPFKQIGLPENCGANFTRNLRINSTDGVSLGAWHMLPAALHGITISTANEFEFALKQNHAVMLYLHGNAGTRAAWHRLQLYKKLANINFHVFAFDYRGFGDSTGYPSERGVVEDSLSIYNYIHNVNPHVPVYVWGHSLGTAIATLLTKELHERKLPVESLILEAPFNNIVDAASYHPLTMFFRPLPWHDWALEELSRNNLSFATDRNIVHVRVPILILHAEDDMVVPYSLGIKLYESAVQNKQEGTVEFITVDGNYGYGHKHIHKLPHLQQLIRKFTGI